jgi:hypothetical protein
MATSRPPPPTTMDSLARIDLTALRTDAVLVYADRVVELSVVRTASPVRDQSCGLARADGRPHQVVLECLQEKLQMLLMLSQKLLQWFLDDRRELERLRQSTYFNGTTANRTPFGSLMLVASWRSTPGRAAESLGLGFPKGEWISINCEHPWCSLLSRRCIRQPCRRETCGMRCPSRIRGSPGKCTD